MPSDNSIHPKFWRNKRAKDFLRRLAVELCGGILSIGSRLYTFGDNITIVIAPHQDDETLACGGLIARKRSEGLPVHVIFITDGAASHPNHPRFDSKAISQLRKEEALQAISLLGVERNATHFLDEPDGTLNTINPQRRELLVQRLTELFVQINAGEIFLPCSPDGSSEHDATFHFVTDAIKRSKVRMTVWQYPVWSWWNPVLLLRGWLSTRDCRRLPVEDYQLSKRHAIRCYRSQIAPLAPQLEASLPAELVEILGSDTEFFFRNQSPEFEPPTKVSSSPP